MRRASLLAELVPWAKPVTGRALFDAWINDCQCRFPPGTQHQTVVLIQVGSFLAPHPVCCSAYHEKVQHGKCLITVPSLPHEPAVLQGGVGGWSGAVPSLPRNATSLHHLLAWPLPYIKPCCHSAFEILASGNPWGIRGKRAGQKLLPLVLPAERWTAPSESRAFKVVSKQHDFIVSSS